jgi:ATP-dependent exoDNAse (exonuclease V) beta subunit
MIPTEDGAQAEYVALQPFRDDPVGQPAVVALPVPRPYSTRGKNKKVTKYAIEASVPDAVGAFVDWLVRESKWTVTDRRHPTTPTPIAPHHVCLLFKRFAGFDGDLARPYVRALEVRGVPHVLVGGRSFHTREEVLALRNALAAVEWPDDELSVFATLRGPLFALGDDALLAYRRTFGAANPVRKIDESKLDDLTRPVTVALAVLRRLHYGRNRRPFADTVSQLVEATRAHAGLAIWPTGEQALANVIRVIDQARRFEGQGGSSFRAFVRRLEDDAERGEAAEAPIVEEGTDGVRLMSVHKAKGLEFPVVILCDPTGTSTRRDPSRYVDPASGLWATRLAGCTPIDLLERSDDVMRHDAAESLRVLYVAATRARELLVVPVVGDEPMSGWVDPLHPALYPENDDRRASTPAPGCPAFGDDSVVERPGGAVTGEHPAVRPGLVRPRAGTHGVVWWDPSALGLGKEEDAGVRQQRILAADEKGAAERGEREYRAWTTRRGEAISRGSKPTWRIAVVTEDREERVVPRVDLRVEHTSASRFGRPHGTRFGALVHAVLAVVDLRANDDEVRRSARAVGRMLGSADDEIDAAIVATIAALAHPVLAAARAAPEVRRESPVSHAIEDGTIIEGVLDLAYLEAGSGEWVVVDFKTDAEMGSRRADYERQVAMYAAAVAAATGARVRAVLLSV